MMNFLKIKEKSRWIDYTIACWRERCS